jgi:hypothetical protein
LSKFSRLEVLRKCGMRKPEGEPERKRWDLEGVMVQVVAQLSGSRGRGGSGSGGGGSGGSSRGGGSGSGRSRGPKSEQLEEVLEVLDGVEELELSGGGGGSSGGSGSRSSSRGTQSKGFQASQQVLDLGRELGWLVLGLLVLGLLVLELLVLGLLVLGLLVLGLLELRETTKSGKVRESLRDLRPEVTKVEGVLGARTGLSGTS